MNLSPLRVLLVEDDRRDARLLVDQLELFGFTVDWRCVSSGTALEESLAQTWDLVLCDYVVPGVQWRAVLDAARTRNPGVPFLVVSGKRGEEYAVETILAGCDDFILKSRLVRLGPAVTRALKAAANSKHLHEERQKLEIRLQQSRRFEAMGQVAAALSHNFNNSLMATVGNLELALTAESLPEVLELIKHALQSCQLSSALVGQVSNLSDRPQYHPEPMDTGALLSRVESMVSPMLPTDVRLSMEASPGLPAIVADRSGIEQTLSNLILNARDSMLDGGELAVSIDLQDGSWIIDVTDTGIGLSEIERSRIFEPFYTTKGAKGAGLGLTSVFQVMQVHNGRIGVQSTPLSGSRFRLTLPMITVEQLRALETSWSKDRNALIASA